MNHSTAYQPEDLLTRFSRGATSWVLGTGLLSFHATVFALAMTGMTLWNVYDSPSDLWVGDVLRRWGAVVCFHAILLAAGWIAWRLLSAEQAAIEGTNQPIPATGRAAEPNARAPWATAAIEPGPVSARAEELARRALDASSAWGTVAAQRTRQVVAVATERWTVFRSGSPSASATPAAGEHHSDPTRTWPEGFSAIHHEQSVVVARDETASITPAAPATNGHTTGGGTDVVLDVHGFAAGNGHAPAANGVTPPAETPPSRTGFIKDARWTWVEAAASAWLTRRESEPASPAEGSNGRHPAPPTPSNTDQQAADHLPPPAP